MTIPIDGDEVVSTLCMRLDASQKDLEASRSKCTKLEASLKEATSKADASAHEQQRLQVLYGELRSKYEAVCRERDELRANCDMAISKLQHTEYLISGLCQIAGVRMPDDLMAMVSRAFSVAKALIEREANRMENYKVEGELRAMFRFS